MYKSRTVQALILITLITVIPIEASASPQQGNLIKGAYRTDTNGWIYVHLEGTPHQIGFQNGWLLYDNINEAISSSLWLHTRLVGKPLRGIMVKVH